MHIRIIFLTTVAKVLPIYIFKIRNWVLLTLYVYDVCIWILLTPKPRHKQHASALKNHSTLDSYASNKQLPSALKFKVVKSTATQNVLAISDAHLWQHDRN